MSRNSKVVLGLVLVATLVTVLVVHNLTSYEQPPYSVASGRQVHLVNNRQATDPTWEELVAFLQDDDTDSLAYRRGIYHSTGEPIVPGFVCGDFAERLHNNAEAAGIRAAFVVFHLRDEEPHALNAFETVDYGLVYVDCTGKDSPLTVQLPPIKIDLWTGPSFIEEVDIPDVKPDYNKLVFADEGEPISMVSIGVLEEPTWDAYQEYTARFAAYEVDVARYDEEVREYDSRARSHHRDVIVYEAKVEAWNSGSPTWTAEVSPGNPLLGLPPIVVTVKTSELSYSGLMAEYRRLEEEYADLEEEYNRLTEWLDYLLQELDSLGYWLWSVGWVVEEIEIYW